MSHTIQLSKNIPHQLVLILNALVKNLQNRFDIAPAVLEEWLNRPEFIDWILKKHQQMEHDLLGDLMNQPKILELMEIYHSQQPMDILIKNLGWEKEECGHLINKYDNGYYQYCNLTRFEHLSRDNSVNPAPEDELDHEFIRKTYQQMIDEKIFTFKFQAYQKFMEKVLKVLLEYFTRILNQDYKIYRFLYHEQKSKTILNWLNKHPETFRAKMGLIRTDNVSESFIDIYVPRDLQITMPRQSPVVVFD